MISRTSSGSPFGASSGAPQRAPTARRIDIARALLLTPFGLDERHLARALAEIRAHQVDDADLYFQYTRSEGWSLEEGIVKTGSFSIDQGVGVRAVSGEKTAFAYSDDISEASLRDAGRTVRSIAAVGQSGRARVAAKKIATSRSLYDGLDPIATLDSTAKVALLEKVEQRARAKDPRVAQVMAGLASEYDVVLVARADGTLAADVRPLVRLSVTVIAEQGGRREVGSAGGGGRFGLAYFDDAQINQYVDEAVNAALVNLEARPAPAGVMTVVLGPGWPGVLLHEAVGHGLEGDFNRKGSSAFSGRIGQRVAAKGVTVLDDGTIADRRGSLNVDDEGHATQCNVLIEDGILKGYIQDSLNARLMGVAPTGNGRRESYAHIPMPRMTNTYMLGGDKDPQEIIASIKKGLYATNFGGGQVDITSGKFVFSASEAYWVENGKILYPVKGATIVGSGPESLKKNQHDWQRYEARQRRWRMRQRRPKRAGRCWPADAAHRWFDSGRHRLKGPAVEASTGLPLTQTWLGSHSHLWLDALADEELQQWRASLSALAERVEGAIQARQQSAVTEHTLDAADALLRGVRQHQFFLTGLESAWHALYSFDAYQHAQEELSAAVLDWRQALEGDSPTETACFQRLELLAWRSLGEGMLLVDIYQHGNGPLSEVPPPPRGCCGAAWLWLRSWWQRH